MLTRKSVLRHFITLLFQILNIVKTVHIFKGNTLLRYPLFWFDLH